VRTRYRQVRESETKGGSFVFKAFGQTRQLCASDRGLCLSIGEVGQRACARRHGGATAGPRTDRRRCEDTVRYPRGDLPSASPVRVQQAQSGALVHASLEPRPSVLRQRRRPLGFRGAHLFQRGPRVVLLHLQRSPQGTDPPTATTSVSTSFSSVGSSVSEWGKKTECFKPQKL